MKTAIDREAQAARAVGLRYVSVDAPGIRRLKSGKSFKYVTPQNRAVKDAAELKRIHALVLPPAWKDVWICTDPNGHIQATGMDAKGRKQYRYHTLWRATRDENKFNRMLSFGRTLPKIRRHVVKHILAPGLGREKILATIVRVMDLSAIRVGNQEYAQENHHYGLTTLQHRHVQIHGSAIEFKFRGKSGQFHDITIEDPRLSRIVKQCQHLHGQELFEWMDHNGEVHKITSSHVNDFLFEITGEEFTSKDFRTWIGTSFAAHVLCHVGKKSMKSCINEAIKLVSEKLGNTPAVCKKSYVHPEIVECYRNGKLTRVFQEIQRPISGLHIEETAVLTLLHEHHETIRKAGLRK